MTKTDWREWVRERQTDGEKHGGIISDSVCQPERNAGVCHTRMWSRYGLVSLFCPPLPQVCIAGTHWLLAHINSLLSHHSPASLLASPSLHIEMFGEWYSWHRSPFLWIFHLGCCSKTNPMSFSSWLELMNIAFFPDEVIVPYYSVEAHAHLHPDTTNKLTVC